MRAGMASWCLAPIEWDGTLKKIFYATHVSVNSRLNEENCVLRTAIKQLTGNKALSVWGDTSMHLQQQELW